MTPTEILNNEAVKRAIEIVGPVEWIDGHGRKEVFSLCFTSWSKWYDSCLVQKPNMAIAVAVYQSTFIEWLGKRVKKAHHLTIEWIPYSKLWSINMGSTQIYDNPNLTIAAAMAVCGVEDKANE